MGLRGDQKSHGRSSHAFGPSFPMLEVTFHIANNGLWYYGPNFVLETIVDLDIECGLGRKPKEHGR